MNCRSLFGAAMVIALIVLAQNVDRASAEEARSTSSRSDRPLSLVVMDPLAAPLSCPCVEGYAQRKYEKLAEFLTKKLGRPVQIAFANSLSEALKGDAKGRADLIIGKDSVVRADCRDEKIRAARLAALSDKEGLTTQTGLIVVAKYDPARSADDLTGYQILFGPANCDEKYGAPLALLRKVGIELPDKLETSPACSDGACKVVELGPEGKSAAVISSYAAPLLEGCGTIEKGDLRVVAETDPVPFVAAFATNSLSKSEQQAVRAALLAVGDDQTLCKALESLDGFVIPEDGDRPAAKKKVAPALLASGGREPPVTPPVTPRVTPAVTPRLPRAPTWPQWRGPNRDGVCKTLPQSLPAEPAVLWREPLSGPGLGGLAATDELVVFGDRDVENTSDVFRCFDAEDGTPLWTVSYEARGDLDYGNSPRATPLITDDLVFLFGAFGDLRCADLTTGAVLWNKNVRRAFGADYKMTWGTCASPLILDGKLIVNPGAAEASVVALDPETGDTLWKTPGGRHAFSSFIAAELGGTRQLVGYDRTTLGGWDAATGRRLWKVTPELAGDFNVPTPVVVNDRLFVATENNGARLYRFDADGRIDPQPVATYDDLAPDMSTPVVVDDHLFCVHSALFCLQVQDDALREVWIGEDDALAEYAALIAGPDRVLAIGRGGELLLVDATADRFRIVSRLKPFDEGNAQVYSHPALVGTRLYVRGENEIVCLELGDP